MLTVSKKYRNNKETQQPAWNAQIFVNFLQTFQRSGWRRLGWRPAAHLLSWLCTPQVAQQLQVTSQRIDLKTVQSIGSGLLGLYRGSTA